MPFQNINTVSNQPKQNTQINNKLSGNKNVQAMEELEHLTISTFKEKVFNYEKNTDWHFEGNLPCMIDFYADWCAPCKMTEPVLKELSKEYEGKINIYQINTEDQPELATVFGIRSIPSVLFCPKNGTPQMAVGSLPKDTFKKAIEEVLLSN
jgi:thioredoxin 1